MYTKNQTPWACEWHREMYFIKIPSSIFFRLYVGENSVHSHYKFIRFVVVTTPLCHSSCTLFPVLLPFLPSVLPPSSIQRTTRKPFSQGHQLRGVSQAKNGTMRSTELQSFVALCPFVICSPEQRMIDRRLSFSFTAAHIHTTWPERHWHKERSGWANKYNIYFPI